MLERAFNTVMPFGIKLRRTGRYILSHKNSFLVRVQLLDNTVMECTLTVENTGNDCLHAVANKLDLKEVQYFGLRYLNKQLAFRWVELDKPLKKQIDKNSHDPTLYFGVMYYVANLELLQQEITRYLFYLQLKNNVIDGCLPRSPDEAIELASYMLQAEFGDYNLEVHNVEYFRDFILFPEVMAPNEERLDGLTRETLSLHQRHRGLTAPDAEYNYVLKVMHLNGYGEETYPAKDSQNADFEIGCSFVGVVIRQIVPSSPAENGDENSQEQVPQFTYGKITWHEWNKVDHVFCNKSVIVLNMRKDDSSLQFHMEDAETAKYACRIFEMKRKFYSLNRENQKKLPLENGTVTSIQRRPTLRRTQEVPMPVTEIQSSQVSSQSGEHPVNANTQQQQQADFISSQENLHSYNIQQQETQYYTSQTSLDHVYVSQTSLNRVPAAIQQEYGYANGYMPGGSMYSSPSINSLAHSQTHLNRPSPASSNLSLSSERHLANNGVPVYRCTPDYEQAVRQRRRYSSYLENQAAQQQQAANNPSGVPDASRKPRPHSMIYSQQELLQQAIHGPHYAQYPPHNPLMHHNGGTPQRVDSSSHLPSSQTHLHRHFQTSHESLTPVHGAPQHPQHMGQYNPQEISPPIQNGMHLHGVGGASGNAILAASTPELANPMQQAKISASEMQLFRHYTKPPPPYPRNNSTSTPDLSAHRNVSASSPDLHHAFNAASGQRRPHLHPVHTTLAEDGYQMGLGQQVLPMRRNDSYQSQEQVTVIRGMCTSVEGLPQAQQNILEMNAYSNQQAQQQQMNQTPEQTVQAYLQQLTIEQQSTPPRTRHHAQQPNARHHRPVSYPPRLNHNHPVLMGVEEQELMFAQGGRLPTVPQNLLSSQSHLSSSASTVGSPYGSQQYLQQPHHGSQIIIQHSQLAPATHPVILPQPLPQHADITVSHMGSNPNLQYQHHPAQQQMQQQLVHGGQHVTQEDDYHHQDMSSSYVNDDQVDFDATPQHSQMPSNATMLIHSSGSEIDTDDEDEYSSSDEHTRDQPTDYRQMPLTTIDQLPREKPTQMYVPPKPRPENQQYHPADPHERPPPPYPENREVLNQESSEEDEDDVPSEIPKLPLVGTEDHDPPTSYRKPPQMESYDEGDLATLSVFPHPNPSTPYSTQLSETNPFLVPTMSKNNPFYPGKENESPSSSEHEEEDTNAVVSVATDNNENKLFADTTSEVLRRSHRSTRKNAPLKLVPLNGNLIVPPSSPAGAPDEQVLQLEKQVEDGLVLTEYEKIPTKKTPGDGGSGDPLGLRDRVKSVVPYADNRVRITATSSNPDGYINASLVEVDVADQEWMYIICQSPLDDFLQEFWDMIWEQRVSIVVMISKEVEDGRIRCGRYWPELPGDPNAMLFGNYRVSCEIVDLSSQPTTPSDPATPESDEGFPSRPRSSSTACENLITSRLVLQRAGTTECRKVWHLQYVGWPDTGAPKEAGDFLAFMEELESVRRLADDNLEEGEAPPPVVVHCASGAGRSGVVVLCDLMRHSLEHNKVTTVPEMLHTLREQRMHAVQTVSQYNFVYQVLILFLKNSRLI